MPKAQRPRQKGKHFYSANSALCKEKEAVKASSRISFLGCVTDNLAVKEYDSSFEYFLCFVQGLHVIKTVLEYRGMKRFKKTAGEQMIISTDLPDDVRATQNPKAIFRKMTNTTRYVSAFGEKPKEKQDFQILNRKPLIKLQIAQVLKPEIA